MIEGLRVLFIESQILLRDCLWGDSRIDECACPHELKMSLSYAEVTYLYTGVKVGLYVILKCNISIIQVLGVPLFCTV